MSQDDDVFGISQNFIRILCQINRRDLVDHYLMLMRERNQPNSDKINYIYGLMKELNLLPDTAAIEEEKSDTKSEQFRRQGNSFFSLKSQKYLDALREYNKSICYAVSKENLSIGLANRSAVFSEMEMFPECLNSIRLARLFGYPERLKEKLERREVKCWEAMKGKTPVEETSVPKIDLPINEKIPFMAKCLALRKNNTFGRHLVTEESIPAGTIIAHVEPFCKTLSDAEKYFRCATCLAEVPHLLLPCDNCTQAMFCSEECREKANKSFHAIECPIGGSVYKIFGLDVGLMTVFRVIVSAFLAFADSETMATALKKIEREKKNVFSFDWSQELTPEQLYTPIHTLVTNECHRDHLFLLHHYIVACLMYHLLKDGSPVFSDRYLTTSSADDLLKNIIFRHLLICAENCYSLNATEDCVKLEMSRSIVFGGAICSFYSLFNHACSRNVQLVPLGAVSGIVTVKNIAAGEQLFINYGFPFKIMNRATRQEEILGKYAFHCKCVACIEDYPLQCNLPKPLDIQVPFHIVGRPHCETYTADFGRKAFKMAKEFIQRYGHLYPIQQLSNMEETLRFCLQVIYDPLPLQIREKIRQSM